MLHRIKHMYVEQTIRGWKKWFLTFQYAMGKDAHYLHEWKDKITISYAREVDS